MKLSPNQPCRCGSGKKYKKCCQWKDQGYGAGPEPSIPIVGSVLFNGYRWRALGSRVYYRPPAETFHEFLIFVLQFTLGKEWLAEEAMQEKPHVVVEWLKSFGPWGASQQVEENLVDVDSGVWAAIPSGSVRALLQLAYDLFCLQSVKSLPDFLLEKLRDRHEFQGTRYEVAVAAIIARAGYEITFLDDKVKREKHCEFIARSKASGVEIGVEAKSRRRPGVLHEEGVFDEEKHATADVSKLFHKALGQRPDGLPFLVFIDINLPPSTEAPIERYKMILQSYNKCSPESPDGFNVLFMTNFSSYYLGDEVVSATHASTKIISMHPTVAWDDTEGVARVLESVDRYQEVPREA